jgi:hypothetical protein
MGNYSGNHPRYSSGQKYDAREAYNKDLTANARLHYLENSEHDKHSHPAKKHCVAKMYGEPAAKMDHAPKNLGFIKAETLKKNPDATTMEVDGKTMPIKNLADSDDIKDMSGAYNAMGDANDPAMMKGDPIMLKKIHALKMKVDKGLEFGLKG